MVKRIITISREFGSGGRFIGEEVAKKLGIAYYDKNIINQIAEESGLSPDYIQESAELSPKKGLFAYAFAGRDITGKSLEDMVYLSLIHILSDAGVGATLLKSAMQGASLNVYINTKSMKDRRKAEELNHLADSLREEYEAKADRIFAEVNSRIR